MMHVISAKFANFKQKGRMRLDTIIVLFPHRQHAKRLRPSHEARFYYSQKISFSVLNARQERRKVKMSDNIQKVQQKTYHKKASGSAAVTVKKHAKEADLKLFGSCFW